MNILLLAAISTFVGVSGASGVREGLVIRLE